MANLTRILLIGDSGVGKTSLVLRFHNNSFNMSEKSTIGVDYRSRDISINSTKVKVQVWDTAGQERFRSMTSTFYNRAQGIIICFDVCNFASFDHVRRWYDDIKRNCPSECQIVVCGNKCDRPESEWDVSAADVELMARDLELTVFMASASSSLNVEDMFFALVTAILANQQGASADNSSDGKKKKKSNNNNNSNSNSNVHLQQDSGEKKDCC